MRKTNLVDAQRYIVKLEAQLKASKPQMSIDEAQAIRSAHRDGGYSVSEIARAETLNENRFLERLWFVRSKSSVSNIINGKTWVTDEAPVTTHQFILGDCRTELKQCADESVDLIVTSPPYRAGKNYGTHDDTGAIEDYRLWAQIWLSDVARVVGPRGSVWLNLGYTSCGDNETLPLTYLYHPLATELGLKLVQELVWHYEGGMTYRRRFSHRTERWLWLSKTPSDCVFNLDAVRDPSLNRTIDSRNHALGKNPTDYWYFDRVVGGKGAGSSKTNHPAQFPQAMIERIIRACSPPHGIVLDPFSGSGTTAMAARSTNRSSISIEIDPNHHAASKAKMGCL
ncbi:MAG: site-specific DNA-methyltransferase [Pontixanthobacter sp.]